MYLLLESTHVKQKTLPMDKKHLFNWEIKHCEVNVSALEMTSQKRKRALTPTPAVCQHCQQTLSFCRFTSAFVFLLFSSANLVTWSALWLRRQSEGSGGL